MTFFPVEIQIMAKYLYLPDCETLMWFPDDPHFNQWISKQSQTDYGIYSTSEYVGNGEHVSHILVNWSNRTNVYAFQILVSDIKPTEFYRSSTFKHLKSQMDGITMKGGFLMIDTPEDVVMFRMLYGDRF